MQKKDLLNLVLIFFSWKILIYALSNLSPLLFPLQADFLGGGILNYIRHPLFWGFINFDGELYLSIVLLLIFPTSFFLGAFYNDSLFLCLSVWAFYFAFKKKWFFAFLLCG